MHVARVQLDHHALLDVDAERHAVHGAQAAHEQRGADEQHHGERRLRDDERRDDALAMHTAGLASFADCGREIEAPQQHRRHDARHHARDDHRRAR